MKHVVREMGKKIDRQGYWINHLFLPLPNYTISLRPNGMNYRL